MDMKHLSLFAAAGLLFAGCAKEESPDAGASPNLDTGMAEQNTVATASPDEPVGAGATASSGVGTATAHGAAVVESQAADDTNSAGKPSRPAER
jgi:hypothetical protein